jgi:serine/threonine-protein kinase
MISKDGKVKLTDFGIAKDTSAWSTQLTQDNHTVGTVAYMSPEQLSGQELTRKSDIYALGILLYRVLTGKLPFSGETIYEYLNQRMKTAIRMPTDVIKNELPLEFDKLVSDMLHPDPEFRPMDAFVVMQRLLDIKSAAEAGTLEKTRVDESAALAETQEMPKRGFAQLIKNMAGTLSGPTTGMSTKPSKKKRKEEPFALADFPWGLAVATLVMVGFLGWYFLWPASAATLFSRGEVLAKRGVESKDANDLDMAFERFFDPLRRSFPNADEVGRIAVYEDHRLRLKASGRATRAKRFGLPTDASEAERKFFEAMKFFNQAQDASTSIEKLTVFREAFKDTPDARGWVLLAEEEVVRLERTLGAKPSDKSKLEKIEELTKKAESLLAGGEAGDALKTYETLLALYGEDKDVAEPIAKARKRYEEIKPKS